MTGRPDFSLGVGADMRGATIPRLVARHFRARPRRVLAMLALALLLAGLAVVPPMLVARLVDGAIEGGVGRSVALLMVGAIAFLAAGDAGLTFARRARGDDGLFDVRLLERGTAFQMWRYFLNLICGRLEKLPDVKSVTATHVRWESDVPVPIQVDGDPAGWTPAEFSILPGAVEILVPQSQATERIERQP